MTPTSTTPSGAQTYFDELIAWASTQLRGDEVLTASLAGEDSDFVRFNRGLIRQAGSVKQRSVELDLIDGDKHCSADVQLAEDPDLDRARIGGLLLDLRDRLRLVPPDPYLAYATGTDTTERVGAAALPAADDAIGEIQSASNGRDLVGIYAAGDAYRGFASSLGQRNWFQAGTFNFDWSFYLQADKAVKTAYAGDRWDGDAFAAKVDRSADQLAVLARDPIDLKPDTYRTYLAPTALSDLVAMMSWGGFGLKAHKTKQTPLLRMITDAATLDPSVRIVEDTAAGLAPNFQEQGFARPDRVVLIDEGRYCDHLVSPRSAKEYGVDTNGASAWESPESVAMSGGQLEPGDIVEQLGTGLYVGNLHYLNFSDRTACRTTGMTRFATFWVEGGEIVAPANVLRFDDTAYNLLGDNLVGLTTEVETLLDPGTYGGRSSDSMRLPGALVDDMAFTL